MPKNVSLPTKSTRTPQSRTDDSHDQGLFILAAVMSGAPIDDVVDAIDRRAHAALAHDERLPISGSPGFVPGPYDSAVPVLMDGIEERIITMMRWINSGGLGQDASKAEYQIQRLADAIENAKAWAATGVRFGDPIDDHFRECTFPVGWEMKRTEHPMWSDLVDHNGRKRAAIFYKAAFYDRSASVRLCRRFTVQRHYVDIDPDGRMIQAYVLDSGRPIFITSTERVPDEISRYSQAYRQHCEPIQKKQIAQCFKWLSERYPKHDEITAHWDEDPKLALERCPTIVLP